MDLLQKEDILIVTADHGNDPTIGHPQHTREYVPLLIKGNKDLFMPIGTRDSMADTGQSIAKYLTGDKLENGISYIK